jgi:hypothetical protein
LTLLLLPMLTLLASSLAVLVVTIGFPRGAIGLSFGVICSFQGKSMKLRLTDCCKSSPKKATQAAPMIT